MENPHNNKKTAEVFSRYVERQFGWKNKVIVPLNPSQPLFDAVLDIEGGERLYLQMKQIMKFESEERRQTKSNIKIFGNQSLEPVVQKAEDKYKNKAKSLILVLHVDVGILIPSDAEFIDVQNFATSTFRGIYLVSPKQELWSVAGKEDLDEFVFEIKNAFNTT